MREFRSRVDVAERPEARAVDRAVVAAMGLHLQSVHRPDALRLLEAIRALAQAGLEAEGYDSQAARRAVVGRLSTMLDDNGTANAVRVAARRQAEGLPAAGRRVRHPDRLPTA